MLVPSDIVVKQPCFGVIEFFFRNPPGVIQLDILVELIVALRLIHISLAQNIVPADSRPLHAPMLQAAPAHDRSKGRKKRAFKACVVDVSAVALQPGFKVDQRSHAIRQRSLHFRGCFWIVGVLPNVVGYRLINLALITRPTPTSWRSSRWTRWRKWRLRPRWWKHPSRALPNKRMFESKASVRAPFLCGMVVWWHGVVLVGKRKSREDVPAINRYLVS